MHTTSVGACVGVPREDVARFFEGKEAKLRPHAKTHKSPFIARKQIELGEAEVMVAAGLRDTRDLRVGEKVEIIPSYGDTTINLHDFHYGLRKGVVDVVRPVAARGRFR